MPLWKAEAWEMAQIGTRSLSKLSQEVRSLFYGDTLRSGHQLTNVELCLNLAVGEGIRLSPPQGDRMMSPREHEVACNLTYTRY